MSIDLAWRDAVRRACDPVFKSAEAGFVWNEYVSFTGPHPAMLWEAESLLFAERYPHMRVAESYGDGWPAPCIDYWIYVDPAAMTAELSCEGVWANDRFHLTGDGDSDGAVIAARFAEILNVRAADGRTAS